MSNTPVAGASELARIQAYLDARYTAKDIQHKFETKLGRTVDCIDFFVGPGAKAMAAFGKPVTQIPKAPPIPEGATNSVPDWAYNGQPDRFGRERACPGKTIPMHHITVADILAAGGLETFTQTQSPDSRIYCVNQTSGYAHVRTRFNNGGNPNIHYGDASMSVHFPQIPATIFTGTVPHSLGQVWLWSGNGYNAFGQQCQTDCAQTIEVGWVSSQNTTTNPHLFVSAENYGYGGANPLIGHIPTWMPCPGATIMPGDDLPASIPGGAQREIRIIVSYYAAAWWIFTAGSWIGYYPSSDFVDPATNTPNLTRFENFGVGGEVHESRELWTIPMGSGADPGAGWGQAAYVRDYVACADGPGCSQDFSIDCISDLVPSYTYRTDVSGPAWWANWFYYGNAPHAIWGDNYGWSDWSPTSPQDWAQNSYKGECGLDPWYGAPITGISRATSGSQQPAQAVQCGINGITTTRANCHALQFAQSGHWNNPDQGFLNEDVSQFPPSGDWDPNYWKGECAANEFVSGLSQFAYAPNQGRLDRILCCPTNDALAHTNCTAQVFDSSNSDAYLTNSPDWNEGNYKGQCPSGQYLAGVSAIADSADGVVGSPHALLCCSP